MLTQVPLPLLPRDAAEIAPGVGVVAGPDGGGVVWVHGLATFAWDAGDEAARRLAAVQLVQLKAATQVQVAQAFGVIPVSVWRWARALAGGGVAGLVPAAKGPQRASKLTPQVIGQIRELDRHGAGKAAIAAAAGVSESSVRSVLRPARPAAGGQDAGGADGIPAGQDPAGTDPDFADTGMGADPDPEPEVLPVLPDPVPRDAERALARFGLLGEGAAPAFTPGARYPLAGLLLALPPLAGTGLLACARQVYGRLRDGFYGLEVMLVVLVFMALLREARAEGASRIPGRAGPGARPGPGPGSQDNPPQARRARRRRQGRGAAAGAGPPPRRGPPGHPGIPLYRRAHPGLLRQAGHPEDAPGQAEVPRPGNGGDLGHRQRRGPAAGRDGPAVILPGRPDPRLAPRAARHRRARREADLVL